jgi:thiol-disulfide isomerase/thioredoxin
MKTLNLAAVCFICLLFGEGLASAQPAGKPPDADAAWKALQQAAALPEQKHNDEQVAADALAASKQANAFYTQFPNSSNVLAAKILECKLLQTAYFHGDRVFAKWDNAEANLVPNSGLSAEERYDLRVPVLRELIRRFPGREKPYDMLLSLAAMSPDDKARPIANEILTDPVSDALKDKAKALLRRLNEVGKPLDIRFTAIDGREVALSQMKGKVVLIDFWATWCVSCVEEIPLLKDSYQKFHSRGFEIVGISSDANEKTLDNFVQKRGLPWPEYFEGQNPKNKFGTEFVIEDLPTLWLVDKKGNLRETAARDDLPGEIEKLLAE